MLRELSGRMVVSCHMQSGVTVHTFGPEPAMFYAHLLNAMSGLDMFVLLGLDFRDPQAVIRLTVHCWLHIYRRRGKGRQHNPHRKIEKIDGLRLFSREWIVTIGMLR